jgi:hypothetical protein
MSFPQRKHGVDELGNRDGTVGLPWTQLADGRPKQMRMEGTFWEDEGQEAQTG